MDGEWKEITVDDPIHYQDCIVKICAGHLWIHLDRYPGFNHYQGEPATPHNCPRYLHHGAETRDQAYSIAKTGIDSESLDHPLKIWADQQGRYGKEVKPGRACLQFSEDVLPDQYDHKHLEGGIQWVIVFNTFARDYMFERVHNV